MSDNAPDDGPGAPPPPPVQVDGADVSEAPTRDRPPLGPRVGAGFVDLVIPIVLAIGMAKQFGTWDTTGSTRGIYLDGWSAPALLSLVLGVAWLQEGLTSTTLGKQAFGLWVRRVDGSRPDWGPLAGRNALRILDGLPAFYLVGFVTVAATPLRQRVGDLAAKTVVVPQRRPGERPEDAAERGPASTRWSWLALINAAVLALAVALLAMPPPEAEFAGHSQTELEAFADDAMEAMLVGDIDLAAARRLLARDAFRDADLVRLFAFLEDTAGPITGGWQIIDQQESVDVLDGRRFPFYGFRIEASFREADGVVSLALVDRDGQLRVGGLQVVIR